MKRIITLLSASAVMLSAVSCSKSDPAGPGPEPGPVVESPANCYM